VDKETLLEAAFVFFRVAFSFFAAIAAGKLLAPYACELRGSNTIGAEYAAVVVSVFWAAWFFGERLKHMLSDEDEC